MLRKIFTKRCRKRQAKTYRVGLVSMARPRMSAYIAKDVRASICLLVRRFLCWFVCQLDVDDENDEDE